MKKFSTELTIAYFLIPIFSFAQTSACGGYHSLSICNDHTVQTWGDDLSGQLGDGEPRISSATPVHVIGLTGITAVSGGLSHSLALKNDSTVWAWGSNYSGELGSGSNTVDTALPGMVTGLSGIIAIVAGREHSLALKNDGTVWAWGNNNKGQLGNGTNTISRIPIQVTGLTGIIAIRGGLYFSLALKNDGSVWAWGDNFFGQLGNGTNVDSNIPIQVSLLSGITAIATEGNHCLALKNDSTISAWGCNNNGQLGDATNSNSNIPLQLGLTGIIEIGAGGYHSLAVQNDGSVWTWGMNTWGQIGNGTSTGSPVPIHIAGLSGIISVSGGIYFSLAKKNDGTIWTWGEGGHGQLGDGTGVDRNIPTQTVSLCQNTTTVNEITDENTFSIYPNPSNETLVITLTVDTFNQNQFQIFNSIGELIKEVSLSQTLQININDLPNGLYFIHQKKYPQKTLKFIKK